MLDNLNSWVEQQVLKLPVIDANDQFGRKLDLSFNGNTLVAPVEVDNGVYIFNRNENQIWSQNFILIFGVSTISLDNSGSVFMIGAPFDLGGGIGDLGGEGTRTSGSITSFVFKDGGWIQQARITSNRQRVGSIWDLSGDGKILIGGGRSILEFY